MVCEIDFNDREISEVDRNHFENGQELIKVDEPFILEVNKLEKNCLTANYS